MPRMTWNRREMMLGAGAALLGPAAWNRVLAQDKAGPMKKVLFFTKSSGFQHSVIARKGDEPAMAEKILTAIGKEHGFEVVASKDGRMFEPDKIGQWDAFAFETTGDLTKPRAPTRPRRSRRTASRRSFDAIRGGKGFVGMHCATDTFGSHRKMGGEDPYIQMIGGHFAGHGPQQVATIGIVDPSFPGVSRFGTGAFKLNDEWYNQKFLADDLHVILVQKTEGMKGKDYQRPDFPETWARMHGKGRVLLHLDGPPRGRLGELHVSGAAARRARLDDRPGRLRRHAQHR